MVPLGLFLWTAVIKPLLAWFRGEPVGNKAVKDKDEGEKTPDGSNQSDTTGKSEEQSVRYFGIRERPLNALYILTYYSSPCLLPTTPGIVRSLALLRLVTVQLAPETKPFDLSL